VSADERDAEIVFWQPMSQRQSRRRAIMASTKKNGEFADRKTFRSSSASRRNITLQLEVSTPEPLLSFEGTSFLEAGLVLIFLSSLAIVFPNTDLSDRVDPPLSFIRRRLDPFGSIRLGALRQC
jgi:hypothetical protein